MVKTLTLHTSKLEASSGKKGRKSLESSVPRAIADDVGEITLLGKKYSVMVAPWIDIKYFDHACPDLDYSNAYVRYANAESRDQGIIAELFDFVPEHLRTALHKVPKFADIASLSFYLKSLYQ